jgi:hypothetical protein
LIDQSWLSPKLESRPLPEKGYMGVFAREPVAAGELLVMWTGHLVPADRLDAVDPLLRSRSVQVEEDLYLVPERAEPGDFFNHSCSPNAGISGQIALVALRDIAPGEEICYDYAMTDGSPYDEFECRCGEPICRHRITGDDWRRPDLWARYGDHFSPYLLRRIRRLQSESRNRATDSENRR